MGRAEATSREEAQAKQPALLYSWNGVIGARFSRLGRQRQRAARRSSGRNSPYCEVLDFERVGPRWPRALHSSRGSRNAVDEADASRHSCRADRPRRAELEAHRTAMQKVEGSSPFIRSTKAPETGLSRWCERAWVCSTARLATNWKPAHPEGVALGDQHGRGDPGEPATGCGKRWCTPGCFAAPVGLRHPEIRVPLGSILTSQEQLSFRKGLPKP